MYSKNSGIARRLSLHGVSVFALQLGLYSKYINDIRFNYFYISQFFSGTIIILWLKRHYRWVSFCNQSD